MLTFEIDDSKETKMNVSEAVVARVDWYVEWRKQVNKKLKIDRGLVFPRAVSYVLDQEPDWVEFERSQEGADGRGS